MIVRLLWIGLLGLPAPAFAQTAAELVAEGRVLAGRDPRRALATFERALARDSTDFEAAWRAAVASVDVGLEFPDSARSPARDSAYRHGEGFARHAIAIDSTRAEGHFALAMALGRVALTRSRKDRVGFAEEIYRAANRVLAIDPDHDGAHHVLGLWHAEAMRTSGFNRFMARNLLGGKILGKASWSAAVDHLETAVRLDPRRIYHRLDLARIYADRKRFTAARRELATVAELPDEHPMDARYRAEAEDLARRIAGRKDEKADSATAP